jgi:glyoxylase-like metal-dependent hydrolase (beta-lactamase superfamily II)
MAEIHVLFEGYVGHGDDGNHVGSTVSLIRDGDAVIVVDPGLVPDRAMILGPLRDLGVTPDDVTDVIFSHHHPDHTVNAALFPEARIHDVMAIYCDDLWLSRPAEGFEVSSHVRLIETPGHSREDITTLVETDEGTIALTHLWWTADGPADDPYTFDRGILSAQRERVLAIATRIVPGHGPAFTPDAATPR